MRGFTPYLQPTSVFITNVPAPLRGAKVLGNDDQGLHSLSLAYPWLLSLHASGVKEILVIELSEVLHDLTVLHRSTELIKTFGEPLVEKGPVVRDLYGIAVNR